MDWLTSSSVKLLSQQTPSQQLFPPSLLHRTWQAPEVFWFFFPLSSWCFISWENQHCNRERFVPLILSLLMPHPLYFHGSVNALLRAHECRYFVSLLHSGDSDNFLFRMEKDINRIFNEMTVSTSYTWTKNCKWPCNVLYTCFFSQIALQAIYNSHSTYPCIWNVFLSHLLAD